jgi:hypothetical protein
MNRIHHISMNKILNSHRGKLSAVSETLNSYRLKLSVVSETLNVYRGNLSLCSETLNFSRGSLSLSSETSARCKFSKLLAISLNTHLLEKKMMVNRSENVLKGQYNLAQGKQSVALGWRTGTRIVRAITFIKEKILFRTREMTFFFPEMMSCNSVQRSFSSLKIMFTRTVFLAFPLPGRCFGSFLPKLCPGLDYFGLSGRKTIIPLTLHNFQHKN